MGLVLGCYFQFVLSRSMPFLRIHSHLVGRGGGGVPGANANIERQIRDTGMVVIDELSQVDTPEYDRMNERVAQYRPGSDGKPLDRWLVPFGMLPIVAQLGDPAQLTMPNSHPVFEYMRLFRLLRPAKYSQRYYTELVTGERLVIPRAGALGE